MSFISRRSRWSDVAVVSLAQLLNGACVLLVMTTQVLAFEERGASGLEVAALIMCEALPIVVLAKPVGLLVDRVDSRVLLAVAGSTQASACVGLTLVSGLAPVLAWVFVLAAASSVSLPTRQALLPAMVVRDDLPRAAAVVQTAGSLGLMAGPALAGVIFGLLGPQAAVRIAAAGFLITVAAAFAIGTRRGGRAARAAGSPVAPAEASAGGSPAATTTSTVDDGWSLRRDAILRVCVWGIAAVLAFVSAVNVVLVFFVRGTLGSTATVFGIIEATWMVGVLVGSWIAGLAVRAATTDAVAARWLVLNAAAVCAAFVAVGTVDSAWWVVPCYVVGGIANGAINVLAATLLGRRVPLVARGRASTALGARTQAGALIGFVGGGLLLAASEPRWVILGCGLLGLLTAIAVLPVLARASATEAAAEPALAA